MDAPIRNSVSTETAGGGEYLSIEGARKKTRTLTGGSCYFVLCESMQM